MNNIIRSWTNTSLPLFMAAVIAIAFSTFAMAQDLEPDTDSQIRTWERSIGKIEDRIRSGRSGTLEDRDLRNQLQDIAKDAIATRERSTDQSRLTRGLITALGPIPTGEGEQKPEAKAVQREREKLDADLALHDGRVKQVDLVIARVDQLLAEIGKRSRARLTETLTERTITPLSFAAWKVALPEASRLLGFSFIDVPKVWWERSIGVQEDRSALARNVGTAALVAVIAWLLGKWLRARYGRVNGIDAPSHTRRLIAGLIEGGGKSLGPVVFVILLRLLVFDETVVGETEAAVVHAVGSSLVLFFLSYALINAALTPKRLQWRILDFGETESRLLVFRLKLALVAFLVLDGMFRAVSWATPSAELESIWTFASIVILVPLLVSLLDSRIWRIWSSFVADPEATAESAVPRFKVVRTILVAGLLLMPVISLVGYAGLAAYLVRATMLTLLLLAALALLRVTSREMLSSLFDATNASGRAIRSTFSMDQRDTDLAQFWLRLLVDLSLLVVAALALLPIWGLGTEETATSAARIFRGFKVGDYTISMMDILMALALFIAIIFITHLMQKGLDRHILPNISRDRGVRDALNTGIGYIGFVIAALVAISTTGIDLTNLALIAGALSVGLGFGLQNVVNNFVSGLILLAERPIKPGDWVVIGGNEGKVKKVNVRSTEIETFQKASVIIPNADLISSPVTNWTHKNMLGRVEVSVGVAYGTDPRLVESVLLECARAHPNVISHPEQPYVLFQDFADSSLNFEVRAYLRDVEKRLVTASDLRFAIHDALHEKGIEIPFPQRVVHMASGKT